MPFNGSGTYAAPALPGSWNPATTGSSATPADWNTLLADLSTALSTCITKDGQTTVTADIPMATHKITGLGDATAQTDALNQQSALYVIDQQTVSAVSFVDFTSIAATVNNLRVEFEGRVSSNATTFQLQTYGADGVLDTGASDYLYNISVSSSTSGSTPVIAATTTSSVALTANAVGNGATGVGGWISAQNIQAANFTKFSFMAIYSNEPLSVAQTVNGSGWRGEADRITGIRLFPAAGTFTGKVTLFGSV